MEDYKILRQKFKKRVIFFVVLIVFCAVILMYRLWYLQIIEGEVNVGKSVEQSIRRIRVTPTRGLIKSTEGIILADNQVKYDIAASLQNFRQPSISSYKHTVLYIIESIEKIKELFPLEESLSKNDIQDLLAKSTEKTISLGYISQENYPKFQELLLDDNLFTIIETLDGFKLNLTISSYRKKRLSQTDNTAITLAKTLQNLRIKLGRKYSLSEKFYRYLIFKKSDILLELNNLLKQNKHHEYNLKLLEERFKFYTNDIKRHLKIQTVMPYLGIENMTKDELLTFKQIYPKKQGLSLEVNSKRKYLEINSLSHILGYLKPRQFNVKEDKYSYFEKDYIGASGIEKQYNESLAGKGAMKMVKIDIAGYTNSIYKDEEMLSFLEKSGSIENGNDITLTINLKAQKIAEKLFEGKQGALILIDNTNGAIRAMCSSPSYSLNTFSVDYNNLLKDIDKPLLNRAENGYYMPGSIMKPLISLAALYYDKYDLSDTFKCDGYYQHGRSRIKCSAHRYGTSGGISLKSGITYSCNPYFCYLADLIDSKDLKSYLEKASISINPKLTNYSSKGILRLTDNDKAYIGIGQGPISITPLQAALMTSTIANDGVLYQPYLVEKITKKDKIVFQHKAKVLSKLPNDKKDFAYIKEAMLDVVRKGTGKTARNADFIVSGKTGTAEVRITKKEYDSLKERGFVVRSKIQNASAFYYKKNTWFVCFGAYPDNKYTLAVIVENGISGGKTAGVLAREFFYQFSK